MCKSTSAPQFSLSCQKPRRSKLRRLQRLQRHKRARQAASKDQPFPSEESRPAKMPKVMASHSGYPADAEDACLVLSKPEPCNKESAADLRARLQLRVEDDPYGDCPAPVRSFAELTSLPQHVLRSLQRHGITAPMPIQSQALPLVLSGRDVIGLAQTGSGKTLAFLLPASVHLEKQRISAQEQPRVPAPFVLVLAPTRELAVQIADEANKVFDGQDTDKSAQVRTVAVYGGEDKYRQKGNLRWGADIVVATPGRLADFVNTNVLALNRVTYFVLDEADRMLDMGFHDEVADIAKKIQPQRQVLFFSATWDKAVQQLAQGLCKNGSNPVRISSGQSSDSETKNLKAREGIIQEVVVVDLPNHDDAKHWEHQEAEKAAIMEKHLKSVLMASEEHKVLVFVSQKHLADKLSERLSEMGFKADSMHGGKSQDYRLWVLDQFRKGELRLLVCTDVLGRGIDIPSVSHVVVHEMGDIEDYIHRIGRTARGQYGKGHALVFFEYWDGSPQIAAELIDVLAASKQPVPNLLQKIADEVASGKRKSREQVSSQKWKGSTEWKSKGSTEWKSSFAAKSGSKWDSWRK